MIENGLLLLLDFILLLYSYIYFIYYRKMKEENRNVFSLHICVGYFHIMIIPNNSNFQSDIYGKCIVNVYIYMYGQTLINKVKHTYIVIHVNERTIRIHL